jgi:AcrR family transcriptional regulator
VPRAVKTPDEMNSVRDKILDVAAELIVEEGFKKLSMRKIASRLGVTATNLYYYFADKDEINLMIRARGFHILTDRMLAAYNKPGSPAERHRAMAWAYVDFGTNYPDYYDIMYNLRLPKSKSYIGTKLETFSCGQGKRSTRTHRLTKSIITEMMGKKAENQEEYIQYLAIKLWSDAHGIVSIYNSRILFDLLDNDKEIFTRRVNDAIDEIIVLCAGKAPSSSGVNQKRTKKNSK